MRKSFPGSIFERIVSWVFILPFFIVLCACPYRSPYKLDTLPAVPADDAFIGKWATMVVNGAGRTLPLKMTVSKKDDFEYDLDFTGNINDVRYYNLIKDDTVKCTAFMSEAASRHFLNISAGSEFYIAELVYNDSNKISILPLCEHFTGKMVKSDAELKEALEMHFRTRLYPLYDDEFSLRDMVKVR